MTKGSSQSTPIMKICPKCRQLIHDEATICPFCRTRQRTKFDYYAGIFVFVSMIGMLAFCASQTSKKSTTPPAAEVSTSSPQSADIGPAPYGDADRVAARIIRDEERTCVGGVEAAVRSPKDSSILAQCADGHRYSIFNVNGKPITLDCDAANKFTEKHLC